MCVYKDTIARKLSEVDVPSIFQLLSRYQTHHIIFYTCVQVLSTRGYVEMGESGGPSIEKLSK